MLENKTEPSGFKPSRTWPSASDEGQQQQDDCGINDTCFHFDFLFIKSILRAKKTIRFFGVVIVSTILCIGPASAEQPKIPVSVGVFPQEMRVFHTEKEGLPSNDVWAVTVIKDGRVVARTAKGDAVLKDGKWSATDDFNALFKAKKTVPVAMRTVLNKAGAVLVVARGPEGQVAVGTERGLFLSDHEGTRQVFPRDGNKSWAPAGVSVSYDGLGRLWFAS